MKKYINYFMGVFLIGISAYPSINYAQDLVPDDLEFRQQAVQRIIFDHSQNIPLLGMYSSKVIGLDVMHPPVGKQVNNSQLAIEEGRLKISAPKPATSTRWIGGFNPFTTYDVAIHKFTGSGEIGMKFKDTDAENIITSTLVAVDGVYQSIQCVIVKEGQEVESFEFKLPKAIKGDEPIRLRVQMLAVGANIFVELNESSTLIGRIDFVNHFDLRKKDLMRRFEFCLQTELEANGSVEIDEVTSFLSPGFVPRISDER